MIRILCVGKIKENYLKELISDYVTRINKYHKLEIIEVKDSEDIKKETTEILKYFNEKHFNIACVINGNNYDSISFSRHIDELFNVNSNINFIIGGSNGIEDVILNKCDEYISFSKFTFPHGLFRGILLEQIYRTFKINNNERYHK